MTSLFVRHFSWILNWFLSFLLFLWELYIDNGVSELPSGTNKASRRVMFPRFFGSSGTLLASTLSKVPSRKYQTHHYLQNIQTKNNERFQRDEFIAGKAIETSKPKTTSDFNARWIYRGESKWLSLETSKNQTQQANSTRANHHLD